MRQLPKNLPLGMGEVGALAPGGGGMIRLGMNSEKRVYDFRIRTNRSKTLHMM